jgi:hypothetical protein
MLFVGYDFTRRLEVTYSLTDSSLFP